MDCDSCTIVKFDAAAGADVLADYPGSKAGAGVWHRIINNTPPHDVWVELFAGSAAVTRRKLPARRTLLIDRDPEVCAALRRDFYDPRAGEQMTFGGRETQSGAVRVMEADALDFLEQNAPPPRTVIYCDPPYLLASGRNYYRHRFEEGHHAELLARLNNLRVPVLLSGVRSEIYDIALKDWRRVEYTAQTHGGPRPEILWCNFPEPDALHDCRFLGDNFRERQRIKRKLARWRARLARMPVLERRLISAALVKNDDAS